MQEIDFLPRRYHEEHAERRRHYWRLAVVLLYAGLLCSAATLQHLRRREVAATLEAARQQHARVLLQAGELARLENQLQAAEARAELLTYLRHPWPRTQVLAAVVAALPESVVLDELRVTRNSTANGVVPLNDRRPAASPGEPEKADERPPAAKDLAALREETDRSQVVVTLRGRAAEHAAPHVYLAALGRSELFAKVELIGIERVEQSPGEFRFQALLVVRPGYGQPRGPERPGPAPPGPALSEQSALDRQQPLRESGWATAMSSGGKTAE